MIKSKKRLCCILTVIVLAFSFPSNALASSQNFAGTDIEVRADDVIITRYRIYNGKIQYRRWNETKQRWVDPFWRDVE